MFEEFQDEKMPDQEENKVQSNHSLNFWRLISQAGMADTTIRLGTHVLLVALILAVAWGMRQFYLQTQIENQKNSPVLAAPLPTATPTEIPPKLPALVTEPQFIGIRQEPHLHTDIPSLPRVDVLKYTVQKGDTLFGIAEKFGLKPETILWSNQFVLGDNPHNIALLYHQHCWM